MRYVVAALLLTIAGMTSGFAQTGGPASRASASAVDAGRVALIGTYKLVSIERRSVNGTFLPPQSEQPAGYVFYDRTGLMAAVIQQSGRKRFAAAQPTPEEAVAAVTTYSAYFGTFTVNDAEGTVTHHKQGSFDPNETGTDETRTFAFTGRQLALKTLRAAGGVQSTLTWERMSDLQDLTPMHRRFIGFRKLISNEVKNARGEILPGPAGGLATGGTTANPGQSGYIVYSPAGVMAVQMMQPNRPKYKGTQLTGEEALAIFRSYNTYFGPYFFNEAGDVVVHKRAGSFNPNTIADVPRKFTLDGDRVTLLPPPAIQGGVVERQGYLTWEMVSAFPSSR